MNKNIVNLEQNNNWNNLFLDIKKELEIIFKDEYIKIEHIGSTAIKNIVAKPIIDISLTVDNLKEWTYYKKLLNNKKGYIINENKVLDEVLLCIEEKDKTTHLIHIMEDKSKRYKDTIFFRDCLNENELVKLEYEALKKELAIKYKNDRKSYTAGKNEFIQNILKLSDRQ